MAEEPGTILIDRNDDVTIVSLVGDFDIANGLELDSRWYARERRFAESFRSDSMRAQETEHCPPFLNMPSRTQIARRQYRRFVISRTSRTR